MAQAATSNELKSAFEEHLEQTRGHVSRLEQIFEQMDTPPETKRCEAMEGLIKEGEDVIKQPGSDLVKDAALIAAAQKVEHYEIASYGTVRTYADEMDMADVRDLLDQTLQEEVGTDKDLTDIATGGLIGKGINEEARSRS